VDEEDAQHNIFLITAVNQETNSHIIGKPIQLKKAHEIKLITHDDEAENINFPKKAHKLSNLSRKYVRDKMTVFNYVIT
jgi:hypothetical protein